jgi:cell wall assembly regulator SMI1
LTIDFDRPAPPASPEAIAGVEARLGVALPGDYKAFLEQQNGGKPRQNLLEGGDDIGGAAVRYFYSAGSNDDEYVDDLESAASLYRGPEHQLDPSFLPIGEDDFGNLTCLKVGGEDYGAVYIWDHEEADKDEAYTRVTDSFNEFFKRLRAKEELDLS